MGINPFHSKFLEEGKNNSKKPWDYGAPNQRNRSAGYANVGDSYGTGYRQPVGTFKAKGLDSGAIPQKSEKTNPISVA